MKKRPGRPEHPLRKFFDETESGLVCKGCKMSLGKDKKASRLCAHEFHCLKLRELTSKKEIISKRGNKKPEAFSLMAWIKDKSEEERKSKAHLAWTLAAVMSNLSTRFLTSTCFQSATEVTRSLTTPLAYKREDWKANLLEMKSEVVTQIRRQLRGNPVCLIFDGWRIRYRQEHAHGFLVADWNGLVYFHSLIADLEELKTHWRQRRSRNLQGRRIHSDPMPSGHETNTPRG
jgi:hypothetical protein